MLKRLATVAVLAVLAGCAGMEPAGRNAARSPEPQVASAPPVTAPAPRPAPVAAPPPAAVATAPAPVATARPAPPPAPSAAPVVQAAPITPAIVPEDEPVQAASRSGGGDIVVPGIRERQIRPPDGDPRSNSERIQDVRAWDQCVTRVQSAFDSDPLSPQLESPEEYCAQSLGMADRDSIPISRQERRR